MGVIYELIDPITKEPRYVGMTERKLSIRYSEHIQDIKKRNDYTQRWIRSLVTKGLKPEVNILEECGNSIELEMAEIRWIEYYRSIGIPLTNTTGGGKGYYKPSPELRERKSELSSGSSNPMYGRKHSEETKEKIREKALGRKQTKETRNKISAKQKGMKRSEEFCKNDSVQKLGSKNPNAIVTESLVQEIRNKSELYSIKELSKEYDISYMCCYKIVNYITWSHC